MGNAGGTRAAATGGAALLLAGLSVILYGIARNDLARSLGGACLCITALTLIALVVIRRWIVDTSDERRILATAQRQAEAERHRYIAAQAALENEQCRLNRDMHAERRALAVRFMAEREAMQAEFEEQRSTLIVETLEETVLMMTGKKLTAGKPQSANLIQFPKQQPERERSREHGVVGP